MSTIIPRDTKSTVENGTPAWGDWFGEPRGGPVVTNPYSTYPRETLALPDVYKGSNPYLTNVMITIIEDEQLVPTRILLPIRQTQNETSVTWDEFHFKNALLGAVPEEGVSRLVTQQISERRDHYIRYGLAFMIEHGFMQSPKGRMTYKMNLEQIRDAILQSLYIGVIESLLRSKSNTQVFQQCYGKSLTIHSARKRLDHEVESWAEIQKTDYGWDMLNSRAQKILKLNGVTPDAWVVDDGIKKYIAGARRENFDYYLKGPKGPALYDSQLGLGDPKALDVAAGTLIFECKQFNLPQHDDPVNIMSRRRTIGKYVVFFPHVDFSAAKQYSSAFRDILVYDEDRDGWKKLGIMEGLKNCMRFDSRSGELDFHDFDHGTDIFVHTNTSTKQNTAMEFLGEMTQANLPDQAVRDWTFSVITGLDNDTETARDISVMQKLIETLEAAPDNTGATEAYFKYVNIAYTCGTGAKGIKTGGAKLFDLTTGMLALPIMNGMMLSTAVALHNNNAYPSMPVGGAETGDAVPDMFSEMFSLTGEAQFIPYGYGNHVGIAELANAKYKSTYPKLHHEAEQAMRGFNALVQRLEGVCYDNLFMRSRAAPFFYKQKTVAAAVFANLIHERVPPLLVSAKTDISKGPFVDPSEKSPADQSAIDEIKRVNETDFSETLRQYYKKLLNPATWDPNLLLGEGESRQEKDESSRVKQKDTNTITAAAVDRMMGASMLLPREYRGSLYEHMNNFIAKLIQEQKTPGGGATDSAPVWEKIYEFIMQQISEYDKFQLMRALSQNSAVSNDHHYDLAKFVKVLNDLKRQGSEMCGEFTETPGEEGQDTTVFTQLTCSKAMGEFFNARSEDPLMKLFKSYDDVELGRTSGEFADIGVGEMHGEAIGIETLKNMSGGDERNRFGIKRKTGGAKESFETKPSWKPKWLEGRIDDRIVDCKNLLTTALHRAVSLALLGCPITHHSLAHFIQANVVFPFNMIYSRPYMTYDMSTGVCMKSGASTGETLIGHADFQLGDNVVQKLHYGNFTFYSKSVVYRQQNVYLAEDMFSTGYIGGNGTEFFTEYQDMEDYNNGVENQRHKSIFAMLAPYSDVEYNNPVDITGRYSGDTHALNVDERLQFASAPFYRKLWNWGQHGQVAPGRSKFETPDAAQNTVCFQGHQAMYNPQSSMFDVVIKNTGHWGDRVYPGCGKVRQGMQKVFEPVQYKNVYGGGGSMAGMSMK